MKYNAALTLKIFTVLLAVTGPLFFISNVQARTLNHAIGFPPNSPGAESAQVFADSLEKFSDGDLKAKVFPGSLLSFKEAAPGIRDGIADSTVVILAYYPQEFAKSNFIGELSMLVEEHDIKATHAGLAFAGAMSEFVFNDCTECIEEFGSQNQVFLGASGSPAYEMLCNKPVTSLADTQGKRFRAGAPQWSRWTESVGATPVSLSVAEQYEALNQGVIDCALTPLAELDGFQLREITSDITRNVPGGVYGSLGLNVSQDLWRSLDEDDRLHLLHAAAVYSADVGMAYAEITVTELENASDNGITIHQPSDDLARATLDFISQDAANIVSSYESRFDLEGTDQSLEQFRSLLDKWVGLVKGVDSKSELIDIYWEELFSKVDVSSYGL